MTRHLCPVSGEERDEADMLRLVLAPDGRVVADLAESLPGAAVWIEATPQALENSRDAVATLGDHAYLPGDTAHVVEAGLVKRIQNRISLARKAGQAVCGFAKVMEGVASPGAYMVLVATDSDGADKRKMLRNAENAGVRAICLLTRAELGQPFGRAESVHVLLQDGRICREILKELRRLAGFRKKDAL